jgi:hypothetical protein
MTALTSEGATAANKQWHIWRAENAPRGDYPSDMELELSLAFKAGFSQGARFAVVQTSKLSNALASLDDFLSWLRAASNDPF